MKKENGNGLSTVRRIFTVIIATFWLIVGATGLTTLVARAFFYPLRYKQEIFSSADYYGLDRALVLAMVNVESGFDEQAESPKGAVGLMQITPSTAEYIATKMGVAEYDLKSAADNVEFGCYYINYLNGKFSELSTVLAAYNAGEGRVTEWLSDARFSDDGVTLSYIEYPETRAYVRKIEKTLLKYKKLYGKLLDK